MGSKMTRMEGDEPPLSSLSPVSEVEDDEDPMEVSVKASGCWNQHVALSDCMNDGGGDWRKCQKQVKALGTCMYKHNADQYTEITDKRMFELVSSDEEGKT